MGKGNARNKDLPIRIVKPALTTTSFTFPTDYYVPITTKKKKKKKKKKMGTLY